MKRTICLLLVLALWLGLAVFAWVKPADAISDSERRNLAQFPELTGKTLLSGKFMSGFASYAVDQFPLRDTWRRINAYFTTGLLNQGDNNGIYLCDGYAAKMEYPLNQASLNYAATRFEELYETYLRDSGCRIRFAIVPDKGYYLADQAGVLRMDYGTLFETMQTRLSWAEFVDLTDCLSIQSYYRTDTHWRQEALIPVVEALSGALEIAVSEECNLEIRQATDDFYGVYYGQAALPMEPEALNCLVWPGWEDCVVYSYDTGVESGLYDLSKLDSKDPYEYFLFGNMALQTITNPNASTDRELVIFRDSFGSSLAPLLAREYAKVTLIDTRYLSPAMIGEFVEFTDQDVLFLYSTLVLNSSSALRQAGPGANA